MAVGSRTTTPQNPVLSVLPVSVWVIPGTTRIAVTALEVVRTRAARTATTMTQPVVIGTVLEVAPTLTRAVQQCAKARIVSIAVSRRRPCFAMEMADAAKAAKQKAARVIAASATVALVYAPLMVSVATPVATTEPVSLAIVTTDRVVAVPVTARIMLTVTAVPASTAAAPNAKATAVVGVATTTTEITPSVDVLATTLTTPASVIIPAGAVS